LKFTKWIGIFARKGFTKGSLNVRLQPRNAGIAANTLTLRQWSTHIFGDEGLDLTAAVVVFEASVRVRDGSLDDLEMLLTSQVIAMNAIFGHLASRAKTATHIQPFDRYMRLALKAQGQCRATAETLAMMKNPPVFAKGPRLTVVNPAEATGVT
jgi:hypothetical protein